MASHVVASNIHQSLPAGGVGVAPAAQVVPPSLAAGFHATVARALEECGYGTQGEAVQAETCVCKHAIRRRWRV